MLVKREHTIHSEVAVVQNDLRWIKKEIKGQRADLNAIRNSLVNWRIKVAGISAIVAILSALVLRASF